MGVANVDTDSLHVHVYFNDPMTKVVLKELKHFNKCNLSFLSIVWCSKSARRYDHIICGRACLHFKLICSCTCNCNWKEDTCTSILTDKRNATDFLCQGF